MIFGEEKIYMTQNVIHPPVFYTIEQKQVCSQLITKGEQT